MKRLLTSAVVLLGCSSSTAGPARRREHFELKSRKLDIRAINAQNGVPLVRAQAWLASAQTAGGFTPGGMLGDFFRHLLRR